jgi:hypothetical protein
MKLAKLKDIVCHPTRSPASAIVWSTIWDWRTQVTQHSLCMWLGIHWTDQPVHSDHVKKHDWHIWLRLNLAVAGNRLNHDHHTQLRDTKILYTKPGYTEATQMKLRPTKWKDGTLLSRSRKPLIHAFRKQRSLHSPPPKAWLMRSQSFSGSAPIVLAHLPSPNSLVDTPMC